MVVRLARRLLRRGLGYGPAGRGRAQKSSAAAATRCFRSDMKL